MSSSTRPTAASRAGLERSPIEPDCLAGMSAAAMALAPAGVDPAGTHQLTALAAGETLEAPAVIETARHLAVRAALSSLLRAWADAGIEALVFKGFHLAEFIYPAPGLRRYSDVDLLIDPRNGLRAAEIAVAEGWLELWHAARAASAHGLRGPGYQGHELMQLRHARSGVHLDVHRRLVHNNHNRLSDFGRQQRITESAWAESGRTELLGSPVRQLQPVDAILVGLVLNRCWSPEDWALRPHDYHDFRLIVERHGVERDELLQRARRLGCERTLKIFMQRCDPYRGVCRLDPPRPWRRQLWNLQVAPERGNRYLQRAHFSLRDWLLAPYEIACELPGVLQVVASTGGREPWPAAVAHGLLGTPGRRTDLEPGRWRGIKRGVHRSLRILGRGGKDGRELEAVALCHALRRRSYAATLHRSRPSPRVPGHQYATFWLELDGKPLNPSGTLLAAE